jgi:hypothetical protein
VRLAADRPGRFRCADGPPDGHSKTETTKNIDGHLFAQDRSIILTAINQAVTRLYAYENNEPNADGDADAVA